MLQTTTENKQYNYFYFLSTLSMAIMSCSAVLGNKLIETPFGIISAASLVSPFWFVLGDIITEVYGLKNVMKLFWSVIICQFMFSLICSLLINLKSPPFWNGQAGYDLVLGHLFRIAVFQFIGILIAWNVNARLLDKWRILTLGKYFWLRSIGSSGIGLVIFSLISVFPSVLGLFPLKIVISIVTWSCILKLVLTTLLALPSTIIVILLKKSENISHENQEFKFNPFQQKQIA